MVLLRKRENKFPEAVTKDFIDFFEIAGPDYAAWSKNLNMHFGYYRLSLNPFRREQLLEEMNRQVLSELTIANQPRGSYVDLGCGFGATLERAAEEYTQAQFKGVTIVPAHLAVVRKRLARFKGRVEAFLEDFQALPFADSSLDGAFAIEAECYADGPDKRPFIEEAQRVLKPDRRLVVAGCFLTGQPKQMNWLLRAAYRKLCNNWEVQEMSYLPAFLDALSDNGFTDIRVQDISWRVAPSVAHAPFVVAWFVLKKLLKGEKLHQKQLNNLGASLLSGVLGIHRSHFSYLIISGRRA